MNMKFKIGDRVIGTRCGVEGKKGIIIDIMNDCLPYGVKFDERLSFGHDLGVGDEGAQCENGFGYWCTEDALELLELEIGTRVESIVEVGCKQVVGAKGTIIGIEGDLYAIKFDEFIGGHNFEHYDELICKDGHGWWCADDKLKVIEDKEPFKIGDRVVSVNIDCIPNGKKGTVVSILDDFFTNQYGVEFDEDVDGHNLSLNEVTCIQGHGWYCSFNEIELNKQPTIRFIDNDTEEVLFEAETIVTDIESDLHKKEFKLGDRVVGVKMNAFGDILGEIGTIVDVSDHDTYGVVFDNNVNGHSLISSGNRCEEGYGLWCSPNQIELAKEEKSEVVTPKSLLKFGQVVEISCYGGKRMGVVTVETTGRIQTSHGYHEFSDYNDDLLDDDQSIDKIYENSNEGLKLIWDRDTFVDWSKIEVDTKIQVKWSKRDVWQNRHFAKYENGSIYTHSEGFTSFTNVDNDVTRWNFARLYKEEV